MGCGASAERALSSAALKAGELRDQSKPDTVILKADIAKTAQRFTEAVEGHVIKLECGTAEVEATGEKQPGRTSVAGSLQRERHNSCEDKVPRNSSPVAKNPNISRTIPISESPDSPKAPKPLPALNNSEKAEITTISVGDFNSAAAAINVSNWDPEGESEPASINSAGRPPPTTTHPSLSPSLPPVQSYSTQLSAGETLPKNVLENPRPESRQQQVQLVSDPDQEQLDYHQPERLALDEERAQPSDDLNAMKSREHNAGAHQAAGATTDNGSKTPLDGMSSLSTNAHSKARPSKPCVGKLTSMGATPPSVATSVSASASPSAAPPPPPPFSQTRPQQPPKHLEQHQQQQQSQQPRMVDCAVSLQYLIEFCASVPEDMPTWKVVTDIIVPATRSRQCRYVEMVDKRHVGHCDYFISHRWATPFSHLVRYVRKHLVELGNVMEERASAGRSSTAASAAAVPGMFMPKTRSTVDLKKASSCCGDVEDEEDGAKRSADQVFVWCDIFAINQHPGQVQADDLAQLKDCVDASQQTLLCLDDKGLVLTRIWCLYEIWNTILAGGPPKLAVLGYDVNQVAFKEVYITMDVAEAQATVDSDRVRILADIAASTGLQELNMVIKNALIESTEAEAENALKVLLPQAKEWKEFSRVVETINKHCQMLTSVGRYQEGQRYGNIIQSVTSTFQKAQAARTHQSAAASKAVRTSTSGSVMPPREAVTGQVSATATAASAGGSGRKDELPEWHWSRYPKDAALRQAVDRATSSEQHSRFDSAMKQYREAVEAASKHVKSASSTAASKQDAELDLAGCQLHLATFLAARGYPDQAVKDAGEPASAIFESHCRSSFPGPFNELVFASVGHQVALMAKHNWECKDLRSRLLDAALIIRETHLGPTHEFTLETLREKAELTYMTGDFPMGVQLFRKLAVRMSDGTDLAAKPPPSASAAAAAAATAALQELSTKACEVWSLLATYLSSMEDGGDECIRICRAIIPHKRRNHIRRLREAASEPSSEWHQDAMAELLRLGLSRAVVTSRPSSSASTGSLAARRSGGGMLVDLEPDGLSDPDDPRVDVIAHITELTTWATVLAKKGQMTDAVLLQWRLAEACRGTKQLATMDVQLPSGKVNMVDAYDRCLLLDLQVPGIAKLAAKMMAERDGTAGPGSAPDASPTAPGIITTTTTTTSAAAAAPPAALYDGPGYMELVQAMTTKWSAMDFAGAEPLCRQLVVCQAAGHGAVSKEVVDAREQLARLLNGAGRKQEALEEMRSALGVHEQLLHGKDPTMARTLQSLADMVEDREEAEKLHRRAVDLLKKVHGPDHAEVGQAMMQLGGFIMNDYTRLEEGQKLMQQGLDKQEKFLAKQAAKAKAF